MPFSNGDPVYVCARTQNAIPIGETNTSVRVHRTTIGTPGEWNVGDVVKIKQTGGPYKFFGYNHADDLADVALLVRSDKMIIATTCTGMGTDELTLTLTAPGPAGQDLIVCYRVGMEGTYDALHQDRADDKLDVHRVNIDAVHAWLDVFGVKHSFSSSANVKQASKIDGMSIQTNPPA